MAWCRNKWIRTYGHIAFKFCTHRRLHVSNRNSFPWFIWSDWQIMKAQAHLTFNHRKYKNNGKGWYFLFDDDIKTKVRKVPHHHLTWIGRMQLPAWNAISATSKLQCLIYVIITKWMTGIVIVGKHLVSVAGISNTSFRTRTMNISNMSISLKDDNKGFIEVSMQLVAR